MMSDPAPTDTALVEVTHSVGNTSDASNVANIASDGDLAGDVSVEAYRIACAFIDSDGRHSDDELWPLPKYREMLFMQ